MPRWRRLFLIAGIPGLLLYGVCVTLQWRSALALTEFSVLQKNFPPDSQHPTPPAVLEKKTSKLAEAAQLVPTDPEPAYQLALLNLVKAEAMSLSPTEAAAKLNSGPDEGLKVILRAGLRAIRLAILRNPGVAEYHLTAALLLQNLSGTNLDGLTSGNMETAVMAHLRTSETLDPYKPSLHFQLGSFQMALGDREAARRDFAVALTDSYHFARPVLTLVWSMVGDVRELRESLGTNPLSRSLLADFLWSLGYYAEAEEQYSLVEATKGIDQRTGEVLIEHFLRVHKCEKAREVISRLLREQPSIYPYNAARLEYFRGKSFHLEERYEDAISCYEHSLALDPSFVPSHMDLGKAYLEEGEPQKAIARWRYLLSRNIKVPREVAGPGEIHFGLGRAYEALGDPRRALTEYLRASSQDPLNEAYAKKASEVTKGF